MINCINAMNEFKYEKLIIMLSAIATGVLTKAQFKIMRDEVAKVDQREQDHDQMQWERENSVG